MSKPFGDTSQTGLAPGKQAERGRKLSFFLAAKNRRQPPQTLNSYFPLSFHTTCNLHSVVSWTAAFDIHLNEILNYWISPTCSVRFTLFSEPTFWVIGYNAHYWERQTAMMQSEIKVSLGKAQVIDNVPKVIKELKFGALCVSSSCSSLSAVKFRR